MDYIILRYIRITCLNLLLIYFLNAFALVAEVIFVITTAVKDVCGKPPTERIFLDKYGKICLSLDEIIWTVR